MAQTVAERKQEIQEFLQDMMDSDCIPLRNFEITVTRHNKTTWTINDQKCSGLAEATDRLFTVWEALNQKEGLPMAQ